MANSSSSSFLAVGVDSKRFYQLYPDTDPYDKFELDSMDDGDIIGEQMVRISDECVDSTDAKQFVENMMTTIVRLEELGFKPEDIKVFYGEKYC